MFLLEPKFLYLIFFRDFGWVTKENTLRYKFCAWLGYLSNFYYNGDFSNQMKSSTSKVPSGLCLPIGYAEGSNFTGKLPFK